MRKSILPFALLLAAAILPGTDAAAQCTAQQAALNDLQQQYDVLLVDLEQQTKELQKLIPDTTQSAGKPHHINFAVTFKPQRYSFDLVRITMNPRELSLKLPQVTMKRKSFSVPTTTGKWRVTNVGFGIKTRTWVITTGSKTVSFSVPEVRMGETKVKMQVPEFRKERKDISFKIPEFKMTSPIPVEGGDSLEQRTEAITKMAGDINSNAARLEESQKEKAAELVTRLFDCIEAELVAQSLAAQKAFVQAEADMNKSIADLRDSNIDPANVKTDDGATVNLLAMQEQVRAEFRQNKDNIDAAIRDIGAQKQAILQSLRS